MEAGKVFRRREGETAEENETTRVKRRKLEEEEEEEVECDSLDSASSSSVSCCSSNNRSQEKSKLMMEEDDCGDYDQTETSWIYNNFINRRDTEEEDAVNVDSVAMEMEEVKSCLIEKKRERREMVKEAEVEDFFQAAEKDLRNELLECSIKYNFDFEKDEPLGGRYEWLKFNP